MIVVYKRHDFDSTEPVLAYDADEEQLWGLPEIWESHLSFVGLTEEEFAEFFDGPNLWASEAEEDPFADMPNAEDYVRNYPVGSEEMPDIPTPEPLERRDEE